MGNPAGVRRDFSFLERRRFEAIGLLGQGLTETEVGRQLKVARQTVSRWAGQYRHQGSSTLAKARRAYASEQPQGCMPIGNVISSPLPIEHVPWRDGERPGIRWNWRGAGGL